MYPTKGMPDFFLIHCDVSVFGFLMWQPGGNTIQIYCCDFVIFAA